MEEKIMFSMSIILLLILVFAIIDGKKQSKLKYEFFKDICKFDLEDFTIEKFNKLVNIKMQSGDVFRNVTMDEYMTIHNPFKKGSYRIYRDKIESEYHFSKGEGYFVYKGSKYKVSIYGDENLSIKKIEFINKADYKDVKLEDVIWDFKDGKTVEVIGNSFNFGTRYSFTKVKED